jgi:hypothetical protein
MAFHLPESTISPSFVLALFRLQIAPKEADGSNPPCLQLCAAHRTTGNALVRIIAGVIKPLVEAFSAEYMLAFAIVVSDAACPLSDCLVADLTISC